MLLEKPWSQLEESIHKPSDYSAVMYVYVGIVGWIYRTKIDLISTLLVSLLFRAVVIPTSFFISRNFFPLTCSWSFFPLFYGHSSMCMQGQMKEDSSPIA